MGDYIIALLIILVFCGGLIFIAYKGMKKSGKLKSKKDLRAEQLGATLTATLKHSGGLPLPDGVFVDVFYCPDKIVFKKDGQEITVAKEKITGIDLVMGKNVQSQVASGAVAGKYILGGTTGAAIGALAATTVYLVISYVSDNEDRHIFLVATGTFGNKLKKDFDRTTTVSRNIEL